ncbi:MAG: pilin [Pseudomonadota bacterium]
MRRIPSGFTMVEMMAVLAVIAILSLLALPTYLDRIAREQVTGALPLADVAKKPIAEIWALLQVMPEDNKAAGIPAPEKIVNNYVSSLTVRNGAIDLKFGNRAGKAIQEKTLTLRPAVVEDEPQVPVAWVCGYAEPPSPMKLLGTDSTSVPQEYLPLECRSLGRK